MSDENSSEKTNDESTQKETQTEEYNDERSIHSDNIGEYPALGLSGIFASPLVHTKSVIKMRLSNVSVASKTHSVRSRFSVKLKVRTIYNTWLEAISYIILCVQPSVRLSMLKRPFVSRCV